jgi:hypothetical protein
MRGGHPKRKPKLEPHVTAAAGGGDPLGRLRLPTQRGSITIVLEQEGVVMRGDPFVIIGGVAGSYFDPTQLLFAIAAASTGWLRKPLIVLGIGCLYIALKVGILGAVIPHVVFVDAAFISLNYLIGFSLGQIARLAPGLRRYRPPTAEPRSGAREGAASPGAHQKPLP